MNKKTGILGLGILTVLLIGSFSFSAFAQDSQLSIIGSKNNSHSAKFIPGQLVVGLEKPDPNFNAKVSLHGGQVISSIDQINAIVVKVPLNTEEQFISAISKNPNVVYVERDAIMTATSLDQYYNIQWGLQRIGMDSVWSNPAIDPLLGTGTIVAVVDTGIYDNHPDFAGTTIRTDLDYDFVDNDNDTRPTTTCISQNGIRAEYHGTFVAGVIAATKDNTIGVAGIGPFDILPVRVLNNCGSGSSSAVANGIIWAVDRGAKVINLSLGSPFPSNTILNAVNYAHAWPGDAVIVAASGNDGTSSILYPAGFTNVISVGATTNTNAKASYSQYGSTLELAAPGGSSGACSSSGTPYIVSTGVGVSGGTPYFIYQCGTGTSFAAPHVSGVAALIKAANSSASNEEIRLHLQNTAEDLTPLDGQDWDEYFGYGLVRADVALSYLINPIGTDTTPPVLSIPADAVVEDPASTDPSATGTATATDDYDPNPSVTFSDSSVPDADPQVLEVITRTWTATDASNNSASGDQIITVKDTTPPVLSIPPNTDVEYPASTDPSATGTATATDASDSNPSVTFSDSSAPNADPDIREVITRTWTATDASNNSASGDQIITVKETTVALAAIHVGDLNWQATNKKNWNAKVTITVHDDAHLPVSGVLVQGTFTGGKIVNCTTDGSGTCQVNKTTRLSQLTFTVDSLSGSDFVLLILDPHDLDVDSNIDVLTVTIDRGSSSGSDPPPDDTTEDPPQDKCNPGMQKKNLC